jgi:UDP-N-acetylmuramyl pentapeptide phosphotransferase/UDP-N-acetylglucosamine-1-phosphate transferase
MPLLIASFLTTAGLTGLILLWGRSRTIGFADSAPRGPQAFHAKAVPRLGGVAVYGALVLVALAYQWLGMVDAARLGSLLLVCGLPAFAAGLTEDITERVAPSHRLAAIGASTLLAVIFLDASIERTDLWGLDWIASYAVGAAALAIFAVTGISNSVNIIDGFNGLASMCGTLMLLAMGYVASAVGDSTLTNLTLASAGAVLGFFVWNFPRGLIFLGDGGAYFLGFLVAEIGILLLHRNPEVSPLCPLLVVIYPVFETLFSMYRRKVLRGRAILKPDGVHLHSLIYRRLTRWAVEGDDDRSGVLGNSLTAPYLWVLCLLTVVPAVLFWNDSRLLGGFIVLFGFSYTALYWRVVRFRTPRAFRIDKPLAAPQAEPRDAPAGRG